LKTQAQFLQCREWAVEAYIYSFYALNIEDCDAHV
jgi:hypothetical protein